MREQIPTEKAYNYVRGYHVRRGDTWLLTLAEWQSVWSAGDYSKRGQGPDRWQLKRRDPAGAFSAANCYVELQSRKHAEHKSPRSSLAEPRITSVNGVRTLTVRQWAEEVRNARQTQE